MLAPDRGGMSSGGFGIYLHWPFCTSKCPYCDFNSHVAARIDEAQWLESYLAEIRRYGAETENRVMTSIYFGGGTPSLMSGSLVEKIIDEIRKTWPSVNDLEITLEANPTSVEAERFRAYRAAGVNRVSMGIQALNDPSLKMLGRLHSRQEALKALDIAKSTFDRVSFDLIYARQNQSLADWEAELGEALHLAGDHLSLYQLTIEDGTVFAERAAKGGLKGLPEQDLAADMYELTQDMCEAAGLPAYEVSNHARPGSESRHNMIYWRGGDYVGIGPGAHGRLTINGRRWATAAHRNPSLWLESTRLRNGESSRSLLEPEEMGLEYLLMSLRTDEGLDMARYELRSGASLPKDKIQSLADLGLLTVSDGRLRTTRSGRMVLNGILRELATG